MKDNFSYRDPSGLIDVNTLSPSSTYFYRIQNPVTLNPSAFGCKIAFYNDKQELIYYRKKFYAHELHSSSKIEQIRTRALLNPESQNYERGSIKIANWSNQGNAVYILEYYQWNNTLIYESVILFLSKKYCYRINEMSNDFKIVNDLHIIDQPFDEDIIDNAFIDMRIKSEALNTDIIKKGLFCKKWFPVKK